MKKITRAIHQPYKRRDAYDALSMPVYNAVAYEFDNAQTMSDVFCGHIAAPDYSRVSNPTVENFEHRVKGHHRGAPRRGLQFGHGSHKRDIYLTGRTGQEHCQFASHVRQYLLTAYLYAQAFRRGSTPLRPH